MAIFKGKRRRRWYLSTKKRMHKPVKPVNSSTPAKQSNKRKLLTPGSSAKKLYKFSRSMRLLSPIKHSEQQFTTARKTLQFDSYIYEKGYESEDEAEETCLYSFDSRFNESVNLDLEESMSLICDEDKTTSELFNAVLPILEKQNIKNDFLNFLKLVEAGKFPLNNVALMLFIDVIKWFNSTDVRSVRYNDTSLKFFWLGKKLFGARFLRFMSGPKNEMDFLLGKTSLNPKDSKINFACPSDSVLSNYNPLGYDIGTECRPGIVNPMIDLAARKSKSEMSYVLMFDGKKIKRGADMDLLGFEDDPIAERKKVFEKDLDLIDQTLGTLQTIFNLNENKLNSDGIIENDLLQLIHNCFKTISKYLMEMRKLRQSKELSLNKYKEKVQKDPSQAKTLQYAMDACRTSSYQIDNCIEVFLDVQFEICKAGAFINGAIDTFAKSKSVNLKNQPNVELLKSVDEMKAALKTDHLPTNFIKQRSKEWHDARKEVKVTGSTIYGAVGCDGLKRQNQHFDSVFSDVEKPIPSEEQRKAMEHGVHSEIHQIATLASVIIPFLFPNMIYVEEGFYILDGVIVSPDGSLRDPSTSTSMFAFEGKAPTQKVFTTRQQYEVPVRYLTQTLFEQKALNAENGTLYMCWTPESTTVFKVPKNEQMCILIQNVIEDLYLKDIPKRRTRLSQQSKELKEKLKAFALQCEFLGEFPSVIADSQDSSSPIQHSARTYEYSNLYKSLLKAKTSVKEAYNLQRKFASQVVVYLLADLDRLWKSEIPHALPVMYFYRGFSLSMDLARKLLDHCRSACKDQGLDVVATASDGEFIQLIVKGKSGAPLTLYQLSKVVWNEVCKKSKSELVKLIRLENKAHRMTRGSNGQIYLESVDGGNNIKTPLIGWKKKARNLSPAPSPTAEHLEPEIVSNQSRENEESAKKLGTDRVEDFACLTETDVDDDHNDTVIYDFEELMKEQEDDNRAEFPRKLTKDETKDILHILIQRRPEKWKTISLDRLSQLLENSLNSLIKAELLDVSKYLNLQLVGTKNELKLQKKRKCDLIEQLSQLLQSKVHVQVTKTQKKTKLYQPKRLNEMATAILNKASYPKQVLNIAYSNYVWPKRVKMWKEENRVAETVYIKGESDELSFQPYYVPEFDGDFSIAVYDKTHLGTNLRKCLCLNKVKGISIQAWRRVSETNPNVLHPSIIQVSEDGKILDQMKEKLARSMVSIEVENEMYMLGYKSEAEFCNVIREGLYVSDDTPGVSAIERCRKRLKLIKWLDTDVNFGNFPPYGGTIKGLSHILYEGLRTSQEGKLYLYAIAKSGTYCVRPPNTLCSESFFGSMQEMDPWGQGILSTSGVEKHISDFTTITAMKSEDNRNVYIKTKKDTVYPSPDVVVCEQLETASGTDKTNDCKCRIQKFIKCIVPRNHFFDSRERARVYKGEKLYKVSTASGELRGEQPVRSQYGYKINEARLLPSTRLGITKALYQ